MENQNQTPKKSKLTLDDFKAKSKASGKEALQAITGGILGACHDGPVGPDITQIDELMREIGK